MYVNISVDQTKQKIAAGNVVVVDVRTPAEIAAGHIPGALKMNVQDANFPTMIADLDRDAEYVVYCRSGMRSIMACNVMASQGFTKLNNMLGGFNAWS